MLSEDYFPVAYLHQAHPRIAGSQIITISKPTTITVLLETEVIHEHIIITNVHSCHDAVYSVA